MAGHAIARKTQDDEPSSPHDRQLATHKDAVVHVRAKGILKCVYVWPSLLAWLPFAGAVMQVQMLRILCLSVLFIFFYFLCYIEQTHAPIAKESCLELN